MEIELYDWFKIWVFFMVPVVGLVTLIQISGFAQIFEITYFCTKNIFRGALIE